MARRPRRPLVARVCQRCGSAFLAKPSEIERGGGKFCSGPCAGNIALGGLPRTSTVISCGMCGQPMLVEPNQLSSGRGKFCSRSCSARARLPRLGRFAELDTRFWNKVQKSDGCWVWIGTRNKLGYGFIQVRGHRERAHRIAYELTHGPIPAGLVVCHRCDNPPCVRPDHLFVGTQLDNMTDMWTKRRKGAQ